MKVSAQVSVYPLRQQHLTPAVEEIRRAFESHGLDPQVGPMSTVVSADAERLFAGLREGFERVAEMGAVTMVFTLSNACPVGDEASDAVGEL
jgi:uncharacterized protein YqgV (UPF0045/DUF77 family)